MNIYRYNFVAECPNNHRHIVYQISIQSEKMIMVEHIVTACAMVKRGYHEEIADLLHQQLGGHQTITAHHHGVDIQTVRE